MGRRGRKIQRRATQRALRKSAESAETRTERRRPTLIEDGHPPFYLRLVLEEGDGVADGDAEVRAAKALDDGEGDADDAALAVEQRAAGTAGGGLRIVDDFVGQNIADVALRDKRADELALGEFDENEFGIAGAGFDDFFDGLIAGAGEDSVKACGITDADQRFSADGGFLSSIEP